MLARRFLYVIAGLIVLVLAIGVGWTLFEDRIVRAAFVPSVGFTPPPDATAPDYRRPGAWLARPDLADDPSRFLPGHRRAAPVRDVAVFYVHPTTFLKRDRWNGAIDDPEANYRDGLFARTQASAFNGVGAVWAPRYRQASIGAFLIADDRAAKALDFAYHDVLRAFDTFVAAQPTGRPLILAGHSQGSLHLLRLLRERVAGRPLARRIVAAYAAGWPISVTADLPALGLPGCARAGEAGCIIAWQSFAEPARARLQEEHFERSTGFTGRPRRGTAMLCVNPLTGNAGDAAPAAANRGALVPLPGLADVRVEPGAIPARCDAQGLLLIGPPPEGYGAFVLPGNNYHVFDYALFWSNVRADVAARLLSFRAR